MSRIRLGQSVTAPAALTRARPLASRTEILLIHAEEKRPEDQRQAPRERWDHPDQLDLVKESRSR